jgi:hypothetical protein
MPRRLAVGIGARLFGVGSSWLVERAAPAGGASLLAVLGLRPPIENVNTKVRSVMLP